MRIIIAGSRDFFDYQFLKENVIRIIKEELKLTKKSEIEIVSGCASGADSLGERFAKEYNLKVTRFPADWKRHGPRRAGPIRNEQMADYATPSGALIAFWKNKSRGTENMIKIAKSDGMKTFIFEISA